jgi:hypothetical protein
MEQRLGPGMLQEATSEPGIVRTWPDGIMWLIKPDGSRCQIPCAGGGGGGAPANAEYVVLALDAALTAERVLTAGDALQITDGGAGGNVTLDVLFDGTSIGLNGMNQLEVLGGSLTNAVIKNPNSSTRNLITSTGDFIELPIIGAPGQTVDLFDVGLDGAADPFLKVSAGEAVGLGAGAYDPALYDSRITRFVISNAQDGAYELAGGPLIDPGALGSIAQVFQDLEIAPSVDNTADQALWFGSNRLTGGNTVQSLLGVDVETNFFGTKVAGSGSQATFVRTLRASCKVASTSTGDIQEGRAVHAFMGYDGEGDVTAFLIGVHSETEIFGIATGSPITELHGLKVNMTVFAREVSNAYGLHIGTIGQSPSVVASYGIWIANQTTGAFGVPVDPWAIRSEGGKSLLRTGDVNTVALTVRGAAAQLAQLQRWADDADQTLVGISAIGQVEFGNGQDVNLYRTAADILATDDSFVAGNSTSQPIVLHMDGYYDGAEIVDPAAPAPDHGRFYFRDDGAGFTQFVVQFESGNTVVIAQDF